MAQTLYPYLRLLFFFFLYNVQPFDTDNTRMFIKRFSLFIATHKWYFVLLLLLKLFVLLLSLLYLKHIRNIMNFPSFYCPLLTDLHTHTHTVLVIKNLCMSVEKISTHITPLNMFRTLLIDFKNSTTTATTSTFPCVSSRFLYLPCICLLCWWWWR